MEIKNRIAAQAGELFMQHGVKNVSMDEIAQKLGISKRTIYQQFSDKEEVLIHFLKYAEQHQMDEMTQTFDGNDTVIDAFLHMIDKHREWASTYNVKFQEDIEKYFPKAQKLINEQQERLTILTKEFLNEGVKQGVIRHDLDLEVVAFLLHNSNNTYTYVLKMATRTFSIWNLFFTMMISFIRGISTEKGIGIVDRYLCKC